MNSRMRKKKKISFQCISLLSAVHTFVVVVCAWSSEIFIFVWKIFKRQRCQQKKKNNIENIRYTRTENFAICGSSYRSTHDSYQFRLSLHVLPRLWLIHPNVPHSWENSNFCAKNIQNKNIYLNSDKLK